MTEEGFPEFTEWLAMRGEKLESAIKLYFGHLDDEASGKSDAEMSKVWRKEIEAIIDGRARVVEW